jgi:Fur family transcriptional regulator, ferric uptake regulator
MIRNTKQRSAIQTILTEAKQPLSVEEILAAAQQAVKGTGIATVYRHIRSLLDDGVIVPVEIPGRRHAL